MGWARRLPVGAEVQPGGGVHFRVWAPARNRVEVVVEGGRACRLEPEANGYFSGFAPGCRRRARATASGSTARTSSTRTRRRGSSPTGRTARPR